MSNELALALGALQSEVAGAREDIKEIKDYEPRIRSLEISRGRILGTGSALVAGAATVAGYFGFK